MTHAPAPVLQPPAPPLAARTPATVIDGLKAWPGTFTQWAEDQAGPVIASVAIRRPTRLDDDHAALLGRRPGDPALLRVGTLLPAAGRSSPAVAVTHALIALGAVTPAELALLLDRDCTAPLGKIITGARRRHLRGEPVAAHAEVTGLLWRCPPGFELDDGAPVPPELRVAVAWERIGEHLCR